MCSVEKIKGKNKDRVGLDSLELKGSREKGHSCRSGGDKKKEKEKELLSSLVRDDGACTP